MSFFDELVACEAGPAPGPVMAVNIACDYALPVIAEAYAITAPGTCPPGPEPDPPELVAARVATKIEAVPIFGGVLSNEAREELDAYVGVRYAQAFQAWHDRIQICAAKRPPPPPPPVDGTSPTDEPKVSTASFPAGAAFVLFGLGMIAASRR